MKHVIRARWLANPESEAVVTFLMIFWSLYKYFIHYQSEDSRTHQVVLYITPNMLTTEPRINNAYSIVGSYHTILLKDLA